MALGQFHWPCFVRGYFDRITFGFRQREKETWWPFSRESERLKVKKVLDYFLRPGFNMPNAATHPSKKAKERAATEKCGWTGTSIPHHLRPGPSQSPMELRRNSKQASAWQAQPRCGRVVIDRLTAVARRSAAAAGRSILLKLTRG